ncbi:hypothetical protein [Bradyrhizobium oligotrophicum]|uniref:hypothetical protein n=1 Tax=Bradyrhizobium oligotrophicum TaxID=44255 RepID=UPI003EBFF1FD
MSSQPRVTVRHDLPIEAVIIDTTVDPQTINLCFNGCRLSLPMSAEMQEQARAHPLQVKLILETA